MLCTWVFPIEVLKKPGQPSGPVRRLLNLLTHGLNKLQQDQDAELDGACLVEVACSTLKKIFRQKHVLESHRTTPAFAFLADQQSGDLKKEISSALLSHFTEPMVPKFVSVSLLPLHQWGSGGFHDERFEAEVFNWYSRLNHTTSKLCCDLDIFILLQRSKWKLFSNGVEVMVISHKSCGEGLWFEPQLWIQRYPEISANKVKVTVSHCHMVSHGVTAKVSMPWIFRQLRHVRPVFAQDAIKSQDEDDSCLNIPLN